MRRRKKRKQGEDSALIGQLPCCGCMTRPLQDAEEGVLLGVLYKGVRA